MAKINSKEVEIKGMGEKGAEIVARSIQATRREGETKSGISVRAVVMETRDIIEADLLDIDFD